MTSSKKRIFGPPRRYFCSQEQTAPDMVHSNPEEISKAPLSLPMQGFKIFCFLLFLPFLIIKAIHENFFTTKKNQ